MCCIAQNVYSVRKYCAAREPDTPSILVVAVVVNSWLRSQLVASLAIRHDAFTRGRHTQRVCFMH